MHRFTFQLYNLPLEMLDIILQKCYLRWVLHAPTYQRNEEVISSLTSVDVCFSRRMTRKRFKRTVWRYLEGDVLSYCYRPTYMYTSNSHSKRLYFH